MSVFADMKQLSTSGYDFIDESLIWSHLERPFDKGRFREILAKAMNKEPLELDETAMLIAANEKDQVEEIFHCARQLKKDVYGNRIVLFAPIYIGNYCMNDCVYCGFRRSNPESIRRTLTRDELEAHYLAGGHVERVVHALVSASKANIDLTFQMATAIDLAGRDVFQAVQMSVNPKVIDTPPVTAVSKNGIQLIAKARVTVRANIKQLVGGAGEETILARVGEGIVSSIGSAVNHEIVLENPDSISKLVLRKGLDAGTAFEILSIDIADIDIGKNIGAVLQMDQAQADKNIAQAKAEERRAMAVALEQEMKAKAQEARAKVIEAEAEIPKAMSDAFRSGNLGIMDYYRMKNIEADTSMRDAISKPAGAQNKPIK